MKIACPHCGQRLETDEGTIGQNGTCPTCTREFVVQPLPQVTPPVQPAVPPPLPQAEEMGRRIMAGSFLSLYLVSVLVFLGWEAGLSGAWNLLSQPALMNWLNLLMAAGGTALLILARPFKGRRMLIATFILLLLSRTIFMSLRSYQEIAGGFRTRSPQLAWDFLGLLLMLDGWLLVTGFAAMMWRRRKPEQAAPPVQVACPACQIGNAPGQGRCRECGKVLRPLLLGISIVANITLTVVLVVLAMTFGLRWAVTPLIAFSLVTIIALVACYRGRSWGLGYFQWIWGLTPMSWVARASYEREPGGWSAAMWITFVVSTLLAALWVYYLNTPRVKAFCSVGRED